MELACHRKFTELPNYYYNLLLLNIIAVMYFRIFNTNVKSIINVSQVVAKKMLEENVKGSIVNISSQASMVIPSLHNVVRFEMFLIIICLVHASSQLFFRKIVFLSSGSS